MNLSDNKINFSDLLSPTEASSLLQQLIQLKSHTERSSSNILSHDKNEYLKECRSQWQELSSTQSDDIYSAESIIDSERLATDWLIQLFNILFADQQVILVRSNDEPEYFPAQDNEPARIEFAHGFFASALHEISHWCVAGDARRQLSDFGYWYAPDGRSAAQQQAFERVEIKPQALECLFTLACGRNFQVSQDNLFADFDTSSSTFASDVYQQVQSYIAKPHTLPRDAKTLLTALLSACTSSSEISA
ncbi:elongation factor P hydroxylase [Psychrobacter nivimaris]|uniref:elongation factor P hydroxylase n=1 Tax=Psychrobacter nivimaris TaxID=281738 RepID=UPI0037358569